MILIKRILIKKRCVIKIKIIKSTHPSCIQGAPPPPMLVVRTLPHRTSPPNPPLVGLWPVPMATLRRLGWDYFFPRRYCRRYFSYVVCCCFLLFLLAVCCCFLLFLLAVPESIRIIILFLNLYLINCKQRFAGRKSMTFSRLARVPPFQPWKQVLVFPAINCRSRWNMKYKIIHVAWIMK